MEGKNRQEKKKINAGSREKLKFLTPDEALSKKDS